MKSADDVRAAFQRGVLNSNTEYLFVQQKDLDLLQLGVFDDEDKRLTKILRSDLAEVVGVDLDKNEIVFVSDDDIENDDV